MHYFSFWTGDKESGAPSLPPGVRMNGYVKLFVFQHAQSLFFQILRCGNNVFLCKNGTDDGDAADAAAGKLRHVIACDAADGDDRDFNGIADSSQRFVADILRIRLGTGVEDRADAEVICPALLGENGLFHGLRRNADNLVRAKLCPASISLWPT